jgi:hypothetical protein
MAAIPMPNQLDLAASYDGHLKLITTRPVMVNRSIISNKRPNGRKIERFYTVTGPRNLAPASRNKDDTHPKKEKNHRALDLLVSLL